MYNLGCSLYFSVSLSLFDVGGELAGMLFTFQVVTIFIRCGAPSVVPEIFDKEGKLSVDVT